MNNFGNYASWAKSRQTRQVNGGFGVTWSAKYTTWHCAQWEYVTWTS
jgi:hypothetical protein